MKGDTKDKFLVTASISLYNKSTMEQRGTIDETGDIRSSGE